MDSTYIFLQHYWWFLVSLLGALLVFLLFVQGGQSFIFSLGKDEIGRRMLVNSTGRKWEFTFTTLVTFGGAFFASFPLFYSTSFGGAYWVWILILIPFVLQAVSYEYQNKHGNVWGSKTFQVFLFLNGILAPVLLGAAVGTLFTGANFIVNKDAFLDPGQVIISQWLPYKGIQLHGLEAVLNPWNLVMGLAVLFLSRVTGLLYFINNIQSEQIVVTARKRLLVNAACFLVFFLAFLGYLLFATGYREDPTTGIIAAEKGIYLTNLIQMPYLIATLLIGVVLVLYGIGRTLFGNVWRKGIWYHGIGVVITVLTLLLLAGWNHTSYYFSAQSVQSSLTLSNSSSSKFTLTAMSWVSLLIPFVLAYIYYAWRQIDLHKITTKSVTEDSHHY